MKHLKDKLLLLLQMSSLVDAKNKTAIRKNIDLMTKQQIQNLIDAISNGEKDLSAVEKKYLDESTEKKKKYLDIIKNFGRKGVISAVRKVEEGDASDPDSIINSIQ